MKIAFWKVRRYKKVNDVFYYKPYKFGLVLVASARYENLGGGYDCFLVTLDGNKAIVLNQSLEDCMDAGDQYIKELG